jgi:tRNA(Ile)-lysidine synthase
VSGEAGDPRDALDTAIRRLKLPVETRILVAVSGGADSVALLRTFHRLARCEGWLLRVGHVDHGLRGEDSRLDAAFVAALAGELGLEHAQVAVPAREHATAYGLSEETAARDLRHAALRTMLAAWPGDVVALAHTMDDQAETMLHHLLRGAGTGGMSGMRGRAGHSVRPFLQVERRTILEALQADHQGYRVDRSNLDERHTRVRIRRSIIPSLRTIQPNPVPVLARAARLLSDDADLLRSEGETALHAATFAGGSDSLFLSGPLLAALHPSLRRVALRLAIEAVRGTLTDVTAQQIESLANRIAGDTAHSSLSLPSGLVVHVGPDDHVAVASTLPAPVPPPETVTLTVPGRVRLPAGTLTAEVIDRPGDEELHRLISVCGRYHAWLDVGALGVRLEVGPRRSGERMLPIGAAGSKPLKELYIDRKVARNERDSIPVVRHAGGVVWVVGLAVDETVRIRDGTQQVAHLSFEPYR